MSEINPRACHRSAFTLIELMVVMGIILALGALGLMFLPRLKADTQVSSAAEKVQEVLMIAKQRAKRDQRPTGVRITFSGGTANQLMYIQQPEPFQVAVVQSGGKDVQIGYNGPVSPGSYTAAFAVLGAPGTPISFDFTPYANINDYFVVDDSGGTIARQISATNPLTLISDAKPLGTPTSPALFSIVRAPRTLDGEAPIQLPTNTVIEQASSLNLPSSADNNPSDFDIIFAPSGSLMQSNVSSGGSLVCVYVRLDPTNPQAPAPVLIGIQGASGSIGAYPLAPAPNVYQYAQDPRSSGM